MAIFSGDIPGALLRIPGTRASAAYTDEAYAMTRKGQAELALGAGVWFSRGRRHRGHALADDPGAAARRDRAVVLDLRIFLARRFLGLMCATLVARSSPVKAIASMFIGLLVACIGIENPAACRASRSASTDLFGGIEPIPALVGVFAVAQVMRAMLTPGAAADPAAQVRKHHGGPVEAHAQISLADDARQHHRHHHRRAAGRGRRHGRLGQLRDVEALLERAGEVRHRPRRGPGRSRRQQQRQHRLGLGASLLFGIPGDTIAAIAIGVLYMKGLNPGPDAVHRKGVEHVRDLPDVHHRQHPDDPARHRHDPARRATCCARRAPP